jgi:hypothetical protein
MGAKGSANDRFLIIKKGIKIAGAPGWRGEKDTGWHDMIAKTYVTYQSAEVEIPNRYADEVAGQ